MELLALAVFSETILLIAQTTLVGKYFWAVTIEENMGRFSADTSGKRYIQVRLKLRGILPLL